eukprot:COSAG06_NODE_27608_length_590_cov_0.631365_1_plen_76_part_10
MLLPGSAGGPRAPGTVLGLGKEEHGAKLQLVPLAALESHHHLLFVAVPRIRRVALLTGVPTPGAKANADATTTRKT